MPEYGLNLNSYPDDNNGLASKATPHFEDSLAAHINTVWDNNKRAKLDIERRFLKSLRQYKGEYESEKLQKIKLTEGSELFYMATSIKCTAAKSWLTDAYSQRRWKLKSTPVPEINPEEVEKIKQKNLMAVYAGASMYANETGNNVDPLEFNQIAQQNYEELLEAEKYLVDMEAKEAVEKMSLKIDDQLLEGGWDQAFSDMRLDMIVLGTGIIKGPVPRRKKKLCWVNTGTRWSLDYVDKICLEYEWINPFDIYPENDAIDIHDGDFIERMRMRPRDLHGMIGSQGYSKFNIMKAMEVKSPPVQLPPDYDRQRIENRQSNYIPTDRLEILNYWGCVKGSMLIEWGMDGIDSNEYYDVNAWLCNGYVVKAVLNKYGIRPYSKALFKKVPGAFWGESLAEVIRDDQDMCNSMGRAIQNNAAFSSLPMTEVAVDRMIQGSVTNKIWAGRIFQTTAKGMMEGQAIRFYQPPTVVDRLLLVFDRFSKSMDDKSGIPAYAHGDPKVGGIGNTSSGMSMFLTMAGKVMNNLVADIDRGVINPVIERTYNYNMLYDDDESIKGDAKVEVLGIAAVVLKEQEEMRLSELIRDTNNPTDIQIIGLNGRKELLKTRIKSVRNIDIEKVLPENPILPMLESGGSVPGKTPQTLDVAGQPSGGTDSNLFNYVSQRGGK